MKRCPHCAQENDDAAPTCMRCGRDLADPGPAGAALSAPPVPAAAAVVYSHSGYRYLLGYVPDSFGIWDRQAPEAPVERFPRTDDGWRQAWTRFVALEPGNVPVTAAQPAGSRAPADLGAWGGYPSRVPARTNGLAVASMVLGILWLYWIGSILALIFGYVAKGQIDRSAGAQSGRGMAIAGIVLGWIGVGFLVIGIIALLAGAGASDLSQP